MTKNESFIITFSTILVALIFSSWHFSPMFFGISWQTFFISSSSSFFQSIQSWQPLINSVSQGHLFPAAPNVNKVSTILFYPYLTLWFSGSILRLCGEFSEIFLYQIIIPTSCFVLLIKIFYRHINISWSIFIAFLSTMSFSVLPFHNFIIGLISGKNLSDLA